MRRIMGGFAMLALIVVSTACEDDGTGVFLDSFTATLSGDQEVPPVETDAQGEAFFTWDGTTLFFTVSATDVVDPTAGRQAVWIHLQQGEVGENGPIVIALFWDAVELDPQFLAIGEVSETDPTVNLTMDEVLDLMRAGDIYVNLKTTLHAGGLIRGQIEQDLN